MKKLISYVLNLFVFWIVTVAFNMQFKGLVGNYHIDIFVNGLLWVVVSMLVGVFVILIPTIIGVLVGAVAGDKAGAACVGCVTLMITFFLSMTISVLFLMNAYKWIEFYPQYTFLQAATIEFVTTVISIVTGLGNTNSSKSKE